jgi:hypothetical protein
MPHLSGWWMDYLGEGIKPTKREVNKFVHNILKK